MSKAKPKTRQVKSKSNQSAAPVMTATQRSFLAGESLASFEDEANYLNLHNSAISRLIERIKSL